VERVAWSGEFNSTPRNETPRVKGRTGTAAWKRPLRRKGINSRGTIGGKPIGGKKGGTHIVPGKKTYPEA